MVHYAGYAPRFHPSDFETRTRDGVGADWPITYQDLKPHYERVERELPVAGAGLAVGRPAPLPARRAPDRRRRRPRVARAPAAGHRDAGRAGGDPQRQFGNRPHCIYRGFCLQGCKVNAKASPLITHLPDAIAHGVEVRADCHAVRVELDDGGALHAASTYCHDGRERFQRAAAVAVAGYSIETPRLLLHSTSRALPARACQRPRPGRALHHGPGRAAGRRALPRAAAPVQGAAAGDLLRAVLRDRPARGFARGFAIQTVGPLPIGWAEHVLADGHWGAALREYMRDYNHWSTLGVLYELLPQPDNRVTLADENDAHGMPVARMDYSQSDNDRANIAYAKRVLTDIWKAAGAQDMLTIDRYAHLVGGCRMGIAPEHSVIDADHRAWGVPNLFIADGSVMPTQGSANPALTIMATASRLAERLAERRLDPRAATTPPSALPSR